MTLATNAAARVLAHRIGPRAGGLQHPRWPLLVYPGAVPIAGSDPAAAFETLFGRNQWPPAWRNGVYPFHHFHSNAHEVLGIYSGEVTVQFGGDDGIVLTAQPGDVIVLPAGTGHRRVAAKGSLGVVGAYPQGQENPDLCRSGAQSTAASIARVPLPAQDPVFGAGGPLFAHWAA
jgi:uncharacterized protein YjlB